MDNVVIIDGYQRVAVDHLSSLDLQTFADGRSVPVEVVGADGRVLFRIEPEPDASKCPRCNSENLSRQRSPNGYTKCEDCHYARVHADWPGSGR